MVAENTAKFGKITIGLHGCELPKFSESQGSKEWWKYQKASKDDPKIQSRLLLKQTQQFWAKNDMNLLADVSHELPPSDVFKEVHVAKQGLKEIPAKINELTHCADDAFQNQVAHIKFYMLEPWRRFKLPKIEIMFRRVLPIVPTMIRGRFDNIEKGATMPI